MHRNIGEFMMSRYREVAEIVLRYLEHKDCLVKCTVHLREAVRYLDTVKHWANIS